MNKRLLVGFKGVTQEFYFNEFEVADFFTRINDGRYIHATTMDGLKLAMNPNEIDDVVVFGEDGEALFDSRDNLDSIVDDESFNTEEFLNTVEKIEIELDTINKLATELEKRYPFLKISIDYEIDEDKAEKFVSDFLSD